ncbi:hypothetical protein FCL40_11635 [Ferrimonas sediminicola]|uniref:Uncharacterized protein n=1 Tax=Ferrimonas sediminicola TaxID=2569538 RepID=A0A4U1BDW1_9GAMM|nr:hypothetical protein [Ferrimonas sediminicola]TKB48791.1 hypothetical protein FCL40_11635 [Ferrimonas sediminicola]
MKKLMILMVASVLGAPAAANHYGVRLSELAQAPKTEVKVVAQADSREALMQQLAVQWGDAPDINRLLAEQPTAAGAESKIRTKRVVDKCYHSVQAVACTTKVVYQLIE